MLPHRRPPCQYIERQGEVEKGPELWPFLSLAVPQQFEAKCKANRCLGRATLMPS